TSCPTCCPIASKNSARPSSERSGIMSFHWSLVGFLVLTWGMDARAQQPKPRLEPLVRSIDLNVGESQEVELSDAKKATIKLVDLRETRDSLRNAVRRAEIQVEVNGQKAALVSANYRLPVSVGEVQIDCPITRGYRLNCSKDFR